MLKKEDVAYQEEALRLIVRDLPDETRKAFYQSVKKKLKDPDTFAVLNYLFITGLHHFYLGHWLRGIFNLVGFVLAVALAIGGLWPFGLALFVLLSVTEIYALFRSQLIVQDYNNKVMEMTLQKL
ncbi:MAG: hypothetical protein Q9M20_07815 [Mariprofundaceae bacterium]|nr:hypothetical protein [Mariprofundaceae bacterium]